MGISQQERKKALEDTFEKSEKNDLWQRSHRLMMNMMRSEGTGSQRLSC